MPSPSTIPGALIHFPAPGTTEAHLPACDVAIAMIYSLDADDPLPGQPPGPFGPSDVMTMKELIHSPGGLGKPFVQCLREHPARPAPYEPSLGWAQVGKHSVFLIVQPNILTSSIETPR